MVDFEWDADKAERNVSRHGVSFEEARSVFFDDYARQFFDEDRSDDEERFLMLGLSSRSRVLLVVHCERGRDARSGAESEPIIRIISARKATAAERAFYDGPPR